MKKVLLIGGSGFIGSHLFEALDKRPDIQLYAAGRKESLYPLPGDSNTEIIKGDLYSPGFLANICRGMDIVIHNAGYARDWGKKETFWKVNVELPVLVLEVCKIVGVKKIILTGTNSVYGEEHNLTEKNEESPFNPRHPYFLDSLFPSALNYYRESKTEGVSKAQAYAKANDMNLLIMEPVWVFGPGELHTGFYEYVKGVADGFPFAPGRRTNEFAVIYIHDLVRAYLLALDSKIPDVERFILTSSVKVKMTNFYARMCIAAGLNPPKLLPKWLTAPLGFLMEAFCHVFKTKNPPILTRGRVAMFYDNISFSGNKAKEQLGFVADTPFDQAITETIQWYHDRGYLRTKV